jgi:ribosomal protein L11
MIPTKLSQKISERHKDYKGKVVPVKIYKKKDKDIPLTGRGGP